MEFFNDNNKDFVREAKLISKLTRIAGVKQVVFDEQLLTFMSSEYLFERETSNAYSRIFKLLEYFFPFERGPKLKNPH